MGELPNVSPKIVRIKFFGETAATQPRPPKKHLLVSKSVTPATTRTARVGSTPSARQLKGKNDRLNGRFPTPTHPHYLRPTTSTLIES